MPTLAQFAGSIDPTLVTITDNIPVVEPLDGPTSVDDVMDRFPEEVYQQGRDTHLYRFLSALSGDSGAGLIKAQSYAARLKFEAEFLNFQMLDQFYAAQFKFKRLKSETYPSYNPQVDALTPTIWDAINLADQSYKQRIAEFFTATRFGNSPEGMALTAQSGSGIECEIVENYRWIFDQFSDDILGIEFDGTTDSTSEFIVVPRFIGADDTLGYEETYGRTYTTTPASLDDSIRPSLGGTGPTVTIGYATEPQTRMVPDIERNVIDLLDRMRSVGTLATILPENSRYLAVAPQAVHASSERIEASRLVTGSANVPWPAIDPEENYFIEIGIEHEAGHFYGSSRELPIVFQTLEGIHAYTDLALLDPLYGTNDFYDASSGTSDYDHFRSEQYGPFPLALQAIWPFLANISVEAAFVADNALAINNTPLTLEGRIVA
jgi:hypothetical protein